MIPCLILIAVLHQAPVVIVFGPLPRVSAPVQYVQPPQPAPLHPVAWRA